MLVAHLSAAAANALRTQPDVQLIVPDVRMRFINDPALARFSRRVSIPIPDGWATNLESPRWGPRIREPRSCTPTSGT